MGIDSRMIAIYETERTVQQKEQISELFSRFGYALKFEWFDNKKLRTTFDMDRYYGPYYERGRSYVQHCAVMLGLLASGAKVFYGGDSGDSLMGYSVNTIMQSLEYWMEHGSRAYCDSEYRKAHTLEHLRYEDGCVSWYEEEGEA